jgi:D-arabinose 1-dehydrogenase-like Zn-dependent alcohol dehydrogenase
MPKMRAVQVTHSSAVHAGFAAVPVVRTAVKGWYSGTAADSQDTLKFSLLQGVRSMNEVYPLERVSEAYDRMMSGKARFRVVLTMGS